MRWLLATLQLLFPKQSRASESHLMKPCPSIATSTMFANLLTSTLELCICFVSTMKLHEQWLPRWSGHDSDYCNSILHGTSAGNLGRIQRVINTLARVVSGARKRDHITPVLTDLHWLPIASRIRFKVALQTFKTLTTKKPEYLADILSFQTASRSLRSSSTNRLHVDVARTSFVSRAFRHVAPSVWKRSPRSLDWRFTIFGFFQKQLKTFLYSQAYRHWQSSSSAPAIQFNHI